MNSKFPCTYTLDVTKRRKKWNSGTFSFSSISSTYSLFSEYNELIGTSKSLTLNDSNGQVSFPDSFLDGQQFTFADCLVALDAPISASDPPPFSAPKKSISKTHITRKTSMRKFKKPPKIKKPQSPGNDQINVSPLPSPGKISSPHSFALKSTRMKRNSSNMEILGMNTEQYEENLVKIQAPAESEELGAFRPNIHWNLSSTIAPSVGEILALYPHILQIQHEIPAVHKI